MKTATASACLMASLSMLLSCRGGDGHKAGSQQTVAKPPAQPPAVAPVYYDYGGPPEVYHHKAQIAVLARYGIGYSGFGCVITDSIVQATARHNDSLFLQIAAQHPGFTGEVLEREIEAYATTQKAIEKVTDPYLKKKIRHCIDSPYYYPDLSWRALDTPGSNYHVDVYLQEYVHNTREGPVMQLKVNTATGDLLVKGSDGQWNECTK